MREGSRSEILTGIDEKIFNCTEGLFVIVVAGVRKYRVKKYAANQQSV